MISVAVLVVLLAHSWFSFSWSWGYQTENGADYGFDANRFAYLPPNPRRAGPAGWSAVRVEKCVGEMGRPYYPWHHYCGFVRPKHPILGDPLILIPLWPFVLASAIITTILLVKSRSHPAGHCSRCAYDLTGNTTGICPECGGRTVPDSAALETKT